MIKNFYSRSILFIALFITAQSTNCMWLVNPIVPRLLDIVYPHSKEISKTGTQQKSLNGLASICALPSIKNLFVAQNTQLPITNNSTQHNFAQNYFCTLPHSSIPLKIDAITYFNHQNFKIFPSLNTLIFRRLARNLNKNYLNIIKHLELFPSDYALEEKITLFNSAITLQTQNKLTIFNTITKNLAYDNKVLLEALLCEPVLNKDTKCIVTELLFFAIATGDIKLLNFLIQHNANIRLRSPIINLTLQHVAALYQQKDSRDILLKNGLALNDKNNLFLITAQNIWDNQNTINPIIKTAIETFCAQIQKLSIT